MRSVGLSHLARSIDFIDVNDLKSTEIRFRALISELKNYMSTFCTEIIPQDLELLVGSRSDFNSLAKLITVILTISNSVIFSPEDSSLILNAFKYLIYIVKHQNKNDGNLPVSQSTPNLFSTPRSFSVNKSTSFSRFDSSLNKSEADSSNFECSDHLFSISLSNCLTPKQIYEVQSLEKQIDELYSEKNKLKLFLASALREKDTTINLERQKRKDLEDQLNKINTDLTISKQSHLNIELQFQQLCKESEIFRQKYQKSEQKNSKRKQLIESLQSVVKKLTIENEQLKNQLNSTSSQFLSFTKFSTGSKSEMPDNSELNNEIAKMKQKMNEESQKFSSILSAKNRQIKTLQERLDTIKRNSDESLSFLQNQLVRTQHLLSREQFKTNCSHQKEIDHEGQFEFDMRKISQISDILTQLLINLLENTKSRINERYFLTLNLNQDEIDKIRETVTDSKEVLYKYSPRSITLLNSLFIESNFENNVKNHELQDEITSSREIESENSEVLSLREELDDVKKDNDFFAEVLKNFHNGHIEMADQISFLQRENERLTKLVEEKAKFYKLCLEDINDQNQKNHQKEIERLEKRFTIQLNQMKDSVENKRKKIKQLKSENASIQSELNLCMEKNTGDSIQSMNQNEIIRNLSQILGVCFKIEGDWDSQKVLKATSSLVKRTLLLEKEIKKKEK